MFCCDQEHKRIQKTQNKGISTLNMEAAKLSEVMISHYRTSMNSIKH